MVLGDGNIFLLFPYFKSLTFWLNEHNLIRWQGKSFPVENRVHCLNSCDHIFFLTTLCIFESFSYRRPVNHLFQPWVSKWQAVFLQNNSSAGLYPWAFMHPVYTWMCTVCVPCASDSSFDLALHTARWRIPVQPIATFSPHLGNTLRRLFLVHCNWLIVPFTFPDVGFNFRDLRSTCLTRAKAEYENQTKVLSKRKISLYYNDIYAVYSPLPPFSASFVMFSCNRSVFCCIDCK